MMEAMGARSSRPSSNLGPAESSGAALGPRPGACVRLRWSVLMSLVLMGMGMSIDASAQTDGTAKLRATLLDYNGSSTKHWTVVWVTTWGGTFVKTLWKQGPSITSSQWNSHCSQWYGAKAGSTALDGYSSATAANYSGTNSPVILTWNCRDASNKLVADGAYKFWIQYAEDSGQGPYTTSGLVWTKGPSGATNSYANQGANFASMQVAWAPSAPPAEAPVFLTGLPPATAMVGVPYLFTCTATGTAPITFTAQGLPSGLAINAAGVISGIPTTAGGFSGLLTAANGTLPNATQAFSIVVGSTPVSFSSITPGDHGLVMAGKGPANGVFSVLGASNPGLPKDQWTLLSTNLFDGNGSFIITNGFDGGTSGRFYLLRVP